MYTSKNVLFKGRRRLIIAQMLAPNKQEQQKPARESETNKILQVDVSNCRIIIFDSSKLEDQSRQQQMRTQSDLLMPSDDEQPVRTFAEKVWKQSRTLMEANQKDLGAEHLKDDLIDEVIKEEAFENDEVQQIRDNRKEEKHEDNEHIEDAA